ncbi:MAG: hypothetical protein KBA40_01980 [Candidatus Peribacteraceae bacterium]|nr:hypothetical protein [Candidatus Peribacteraceae bacterium]MBP9850193.1 hypothetical protein [Candidatus Peribacteraceae bacterium]
MRTVIDNYVDHSHDDDSSAFAMLAAVFAITVIASSALFLLRIVPLAALSGQS